MLSRTNGMIYLHQNYMVWFSIKLHPPTLVLCLIPPFAAVTQVPHSTTGCTIKRAEMEHCGRHRLPTSLTQRGIVAWEAKARFFIKCSGSISRGCSWIRHFYVYETNLLLNLTPKVFEFLQQMFTSSDTPSNSKTLHPERKASKEALLLSDHLCLREKVHLYLRPQELVWRNMLQKKERSTTD